MPKLDLAPQQQTLIAQLLTRYVPDADVWAFGSRVTGHAHEGSDLDLVVLNPRSLTTPSTGLDDLRIAFEESTLPIQVDVHDWARLPAQFQAEISRRYLVIHTSDLSTRL